MLKFLRKYQVVLLVVGGSLLMVAFLLQPILSQIGPLLSNRTVAHIGQDRRTISNTELDRARRSWFFVERFAQLINLDVDPDNDLWHWYLLTREAREAGLIGGVADGAAMFRDLGLRIADARLAQAQQQGLFFRQAIDELGSQADFATIQTRAAEIATETRTRLAGDVSVLREQQISLAAGGATAGDRYNQVAREFDLAMADLRGVARLVETAQLAAGRYSEPELFMLAHEQLETVPGQAVALEAAAFAADLPEPTPAELEAHFRLYRDTTPGNTDTATDAEAATGNPFGFGYLRQPRVKLEWAQIDINAIRDGFSPRPLELQQFYSRNRDQFPGTLAEERSRLEARLRQDHLDAVLESADRAVRTRAQAARTRANVSQEGFYLDLPEGWAELRPTADDLAQAVREQWQAEFEDNAPLGAITTGRIDRFWLTAADFQPLFSLNSYEQLRSVADTSALSALLTPSDLLALDRVLGLDVLAAADDAQITAIADREDVQQALSGRREATLAGLAELLRRPESARLVEELRARRELASLTLEVGTRRVPVTALPQLVREARPEDADRAALAVQVGWPLLDAPVRNTAGHVFYLTVTDARPLSPADELAEVLAEVRRDVQRQRAFERLEAIVPELEATAQGATSLQPLIGLYTARTGGQILPGVVSGLEFSRRDGVRAVGAAVGTSVPAALQSEALVEAVLDAAPTADGTAADPTDSAPAADPVIVPLPANGVVAAVLPGARQPVNYAEYRAGAENIARRLLIEQIRGQADRSPFTFGMMAERHNLVRDGEDEES